MQKEKPDRHKLLKDFLREWPLSRIKNMSLEEYAIGNRENKGTFIHWVERIMEPLGNIKGLSGGGSFKYGIYFKSPEDNYNTTKHKDDGTYAWERKFGSDRNSAFKEIKNRVVAIIENSIKGNFEAVENIDKLFSLFKWKLAFLYSNYNLFPVYYGAWLYAIALGLGYEEESSRIVDLQKYIMSQQPKRVDFFDWYDSLLKQFIHQPYSYYIIGSSYSKKSILNHLYEKNVVAVGFFGNKSLEKLFHKPVNEIADYLYKKNEPKRSVSALTKFLNIKEGDLIAIKYYGHHDKLKIAAYAVVKPDADGIIYRYDKELGQTINVEFIEKDVELHLKLVKTQTVHQITNPEEINLIFPAYQHILSEEEADEETEKGSGKSPRGRKGTKTKHTSGHTRTVTGGTKTINEFHNQLQTLFFEALKIEKNDPEGRQCDMEPDFVDVKFENENELELYEVKTSPTAIKCVKEALGQIIFYASQITNGKQPKIFVVGPSKITPDDQPYVDYIKKHSKLNFEYRYFPLQDIS